MNVECSDLDPIGDDELLYRRIPVSENWFDPGSGPLPSPEAFRPHKERDVTGISMDRARSPAHPDFRTVEESGRGPSPKGYYVAVLRAGDLRAAGIEVVARPEQGNPGHAEIPDLNAISRRTDRAQELKRRLADELTLRVEGPFV